LITKKEREAVGSVTMTIESNTNTCA